MALEHAILVSLAERSATGYDLARRFDASIGHFWKASHQQIYKVLARMEADGWTSAEHIAQGARPDKKVYALTEAGRGELIAWLARATPPEQVRSEFAVKIRALHLLDRVTVLDAVRARRADHQARLDGYDLSMSKFFPDPSALTDDEIGPYLALRGGIRLERNGIDWCNEIIETLEDR
ncbi:PadR family transcriptional regulator [Calidifontibacter indicus]|uniref:PadR family transcriptional regulator n=1 Tax=Calidifontibacter indicus TaxID=419650 RepID=UPI003D744A2E